MTHRIALSIVYRVTLIYRVASSMVHGVALSIVYRVTSSIVYGVALSIVYGVTLSIVHGVTCLIHGIGLDYEDFSSMPHGVAYSNIVYNASPPNLVRVPPPGHIIWLSYPPTLKLPLLVYIYGHLVEHSCSSLVDLVLSHSTTPKLFLLCLALDYTYVPMLLIEDPILSHVLLSILYSEYNVSY